MPRNLLYNANVRCFLDDAYENLSKHGVKVTLVPSRHIKIYGTKISGYFDETSLKVARKSSRWLGVFAHEYSHFQQWIEKDPKYTKTANISVEDIIKDFKKGKYIRNFNEKMEAVRAMEHDCEKRTIQTIKDYKLPINIGTYTQQANTYICYYHAVEFKKSLDNRKNIFHPNIIKHMPKTLQSRYIESIPEEKLNLIIQCF